MRRIRGLSLDDVERESGGRWSASAVGAYERGFRNLSLPRLRDLASFYDVPMGVLLGEDDSGDGTRAQGRLVLDLVALQPVPEAEAVLRYLRSIILERGDYNGRDPVGPARRPAGPLLAPPHRRGRPRSSSSPSGARWSTGSGPTGS